jgi:hypothetical protein
MQVSCSAVEERQPQDKRATSVALVKAVYTTCTTSVSRVHSQRITCVFLKQEKLSSENFTPFEI